MAANNPRLLRRPRKLRTCLRNRRSVLVVVVDDQDRRRAVQRMVADRVTDKMLTTPVYELTDVEVAILQASLRGEFASEIMERIDALNGRCQFPN